MASVQGISAPTSIFAKETPSPVDPANPNAFGQDAFLKLLVSQLRFQDPSEPVDNEQFLGQMAQFTNVEQIVKLNKSIEKMSTSSAKTDAVSYLGAEVEIIPTDQILGDGEIPKTVTGIVSQISFNGETPMLQVNGKDYSLSDVVKVKVPSAESLQSIF